MKDQFIKSLFFIPGLLLVPVVYVASRLLPWHSEEYEQACEQPTLPETQESGHAVGVQKTLVTQG